MKKINWIIFPKHVTEYSAFYYHFNKPISEKKMHKVAELLKSNAMRILELGALSVVFSDD